MPLGPDEVLQLTSEDEQNVKDLEDTIDNYLRKNFDGGRITISLRGDFPKTKVRRRIEQDYINAGWNSAQFKSEQREGTYFELVSIRHMPKSSNANNTNNYDR